MEPLLRDQSSFPWFVYILECADQSLYTGMTSNITRRLEEHNSHRGGHYTRCFGQVKLLWSEEHPDQFSAAKRERQLKGWTRLKKLALIEGNLILLKKL